MITKLKKLFTKSISPNSIAPIDNTSTLTDIINSNRQTLEQFKTWLDVESWKNSYYGYGVPEEIYPLLDLNVGHEITYTDLISYYSRLIKNINYLELGVSVGKNFMQLATAFRTARITGFDIENINPTIWNKLDFVSEKSWETKSGSLRKTPSKLTSYKHNSNEVHYMSADIWDESSWEKLQGNKFNIIFSDALHDPKALLWEYKMIKKYELLANDFIFFWDDLNHGLENSFKDIAIDMIKSDIIQKSDIYLIKVNGWLGKNYPHKHDVGIVSSIKLS